MTQKFKDRCIATKILPASFWNKKRAQEVAEDGDARSSIKLPDEVVAPKAVTSR